MVSSKTVDMVARKSGERRKLRLQTTLSWGNNAKHSGNHAMRIDYTLQRGDMELNKGHLTKCFFKKG